MKSFVSFAVVAVLIAAATPAHAQVPGVRGFAFGGSTADLNTERILTFGGGAVVDLGQPWLSAGAEADVFTANGYFAGRGAVFGQVNPLGNKPIRPFAVGGVGFGEYAGGLFGGGVEVLPAGGRVGLRLAVEDYVGRYDRYGVVGASIQPIGHETNHQVSVKVGLVF